MPGCPPSCIFQLDWFTVAVLQYVDLWQTHMLLWCGSANIDGFKDAFLTKSAVSDLSEGTGVDLQFPMGDTLWKYRENEQLYHPCAEGFGEPFSLIKIQAFLFTLCLLNCSKKNLWSSLKKYVKNVRHQSIYFVGRVGTEGSKHSFSTTSISGETVCTVRFLVNQTLNYRQLNRVLKETLVNEQEMFVSQNIEVSFSCNSQAAYDSDRAIDPSFMGPPHKRLRQKTSPASADLQHVTWILDEQFVLSSPQEAR